MTIEPIFFKLPNLLYWSIRAVDGAHAVSAPSQEEVFRVQDLVSSRQNLRPLQRSASREHSVMNRDVAEAARAPGRRFG